MATEVATLLFQADTRPLRSANDELAKTERAGVRAQNAAKGMGTELKKAANDSINPIQKVSNGVSALASALIALGAALVVRQLITYTDQWTDLNSRLINATGSAEAANEALEAIGQTARTTYSSLQQTIQGFLQNNLVLTELGYTTREQLNLMDSLNNSLVISGAKGEQAAMIMQAFGRAMAEGKMKGQELNLMLTYSSRTVQALADGLGLTTIELRKMVNAGELDAKAMFESLTSQMGILREEAEEMPATIGDALLQFSNLTLEVVGRMDKAVGLSSSIAGFMMGAIENFRRIHMATEAQELEKLQMRSIDLTIQMGEASDALLALMGRRWREEKQAVDEQIEAIYATARARVEAESEAAASGIRQREQMESQRIAEHESELARIQAEKDARASEAAQQRVNTRAESITESLLADEEKIKLSYERQRQIILDSTLFTQEQKRLITLQIMEKEINDLDELHNKKLEAEKRFQDEQLAQFLIAARAEQDLKNKIDAERVEASRQQTAQLLAFEDVLLRGKTESSKAAVRLGMSLMNEEKRAAAGKIITDSYAAAMAAWKALAGIPFIGPALGAAAAGGILAAGVSYSAKSLAGRALGGQVRGGESYVVGERGPEVLTMGTTNGKIIPNSSLSKAQSGGTINKTANVNFNITANDATDFEDMLNFSRGKIIDIINTAMNDTGQGTLI